MQFFNFEKLHIQFISDIPNFIIGGKSMKYNSKAMKTVTLDDQKTKDLIMVAIIVLLYILFSVISDGFFSVNTAMNLLKQSAAMAIVAFGMTFVMLTGGIDLSVGSNVALIGAVAAISMDSMQNAGVSEPLVFIMGFAVTIVAACLLGAVNGAIIGFFQVNAFIVTMGMMSISRGLAMTILNSNRVLVKNSLYNFFGQARLLGKIPVSIILVIITGILAYLVLNHTSFGRRVYAIGGNPVAARATGINVRMQTFWTYVLSSVFVGLGAMIIVGRAKSAQPLAGNGFEFEVITAVVLGGCSLLGGEGRIKGTVLGILAMAVIKTGLSMFSITPFYDYLVKGTLILGAVLLNRIDFSKDWRLQQIETTGKYQINEPEVSKTQFSSFDTPIQNDRQLLELKNISKQFPGVVALDDVSFKIRRGQVHALCGENGAGKSTLIKILSGVYTKDEGELLLDGKPVIIRSPMDSRKLGISVIYQELTMVPELNVYQNIFLGREIKGRLFLNARKMLDQAQTLLKQFNLDINLSKRIGSYTVGQQQMIEIAKAVGSNSWIIVMDEPTSAITEADKTKLFEIIKQLKSQGIAIIYITHRIQEILDIADEVTVLRDGKHISTMPISEVTEKKLIKLMIGRELNDIFLREKNPLDEVLLEVKNLYREGIFEPISFKVHRGEVLGFSGLIGARRTEIMRCLFGLDKPDGGDIYILGKKIEINSPMDAIHQGLVYVSEDRRREGIIPLMTVRENIALPSLLWITVLGWINKKKELSLANKYINDLEIRTPSTEQLISNLSGGNQQKVCLGKWLARGPRVIIMDEPTRGIDVGAKSEIHKIISELSKQKMAVILISSEMAEIINASDRIIVLYKGKMMAELPCDKDLTQETIMTAASGIMI